MRIGIPRRTGDDQAIVAATPKSVGQLIKLGYGVAIASGAGDRAHFPDQQYAEVGAEIVPAEDAWDCDVVVTAYAPEPEQVRALRPGATLVAPLAPARSPELVDQLARQQVTALALDAVPRISRAQALDVLSSQANVAGYRAVIEAAGVYGGLMNGQVTAAGKVSPAQVFVIGAGVAGLAAIGTAVSLGAEVRAFDVRPEVAEQVESMGADFVHLPEAVDEQASSDGYAKAMTARQEELTAGLYAEQVALANIVITTALIPGRPAPTLITAEMVAAMKPGSVIVDMAATTGGNCALTVPGEQVRTANGVIILGWTDLAGRLPTQSSKLFGRNVVNLMKLTTPAADGEFVLDSADEVQRGMTVVRAGEVTWPPPPVQVSAAPPPAPVAPAAEPAEDPVEAAARRRRQLVIAAALAGVLFLLIGSFSPVPLLGHATVFILAVFVGFYVISSVSHSLHTPLMAETNAISGIIMVGALLQIGSGKLSVTIMAFVAILIASINVFGGFAVTRRMLTMFQKGGR